VAILLAVLVVRLRERAFEFGQYRDQVAHSRVELDALQSYLATIERAQTAQRGFLLTGNETYLAPYNNAKSSIDARLARLEELAQNDARFLRSTEQLRALTSAKFSELDLTIKVRREAGLQPALAIVNTNQGNAQMDAIRTAVSEMDRATRARQALSEDKYGESVVRTELLFTGAFVGQLILLLLLALAVRSDVRYRASAGLQLLQGNLKLSAVVNTIGEGLFHLDENAKLVFLNPAGQKMLGYTEDELKGQRVHDLIHSLRPDGTQIEEKDRPLMPAVQPEGTSRVAADWFQRKDGSFLMVQYSSAPLLVEGKVDGSVLSFSDIGERHRMEEALRKSEDRYRSLVERSSGLMCTHDLAGVLLSVNRAAASALGCTPQDLIGTNLGDLLIPEEGPNLKQYLALVHEKGEVAGFMTVLSRDGKKHTWSYSNRFVQENGHPGYVIGSAQDVTAQVEAQAELELHKKRLAQALDNEKSISRSDHLTGLANRRAFEESLDMECKRSQRYGRPITIVYVDLDDFKKVNDERGHHTGDEVLVAVAETLRTNLRSTDCVARMGGDEFAILLPETDAGAAKIIMTKVDKVLKAVVTQKAWPIGFSLGVVSFPAPLDPPQEMLDRADRLMYAAKHNGKGTTLFESI
jgi:diguanylate cyclase (GGDEF)-like protein/PAS domain S-box-containing protein